MSLDVVQRQSSFFVLLCPLRDTKDAGLGPVQLLHDTTWSVLRDAAVTGRAVTTDHIRVEHGPSVTRHARGEACIVWYLTSGGRTLHFTAAERAAFTAGVEAGEFAFAAGATRA
jgi:hypothetical protein